MSLRRNMAWFACGFALAAPMGVVLWPKAATAQTAPVTAVTGLPQRQVPLSQRPLVRTPPAPPVEEDELPVMPPAQPTEDPNGERPADPDADPDGTGDRPPVLGRRVPVDGEPLATTEPPSPQDGVITDGQPQAVVADGVDPTQVDTRPRADTAPFEIPNPTFDTLAFQIELDPILDRRPTRLARFEPYDPIGYRRGSILIFPDVEIGTTATSNVFRNVPAKRDVILDIRPTVRVVTDWRQHALEFKATGFASHFGEFSTENDRAYALETRGRYDFSRRTNVEFLISRALDQELRSSRQAPTDSRTRADIETTRLAATLNHRFNRLSVQLRGSVTDIDVNPTVSIAGAAIANTERDTTQREAAVRLQYAFKPTFAAFTEYATNTREFKTPPADGIARDSSGERVRVGVSFGNTSRILRGEVSAGYGRQRPDDSRLGPVEGMILDGNLAWRMSALTSLLFTARSDFVDSFNVGTSGAITRLGSVELRHALQRQLIATAALTYAVADYKGVSLQDKTRTGDLGLEYFMNRNVTLFGRYQHVDFESTSGSAYTVDTVRVGLRLRQ